MRPDLALFDQHMNEASFQSGIDAGQWGLMDPGATHTQWPKIIIWVRAASKPGKPDLFYFSFDLSGYPNQAPAACPWDPETRAALSPDRWPRGRKLINFTFNFSWNPTALYAPCDRIAMAGHDPWREQFPELWWQPHFKITVYLNYLHHLLNSSDYART
ncbi:MAG: hypothetical protein J0M10_03940 [Chitinophagales bacterium]|nr:hypothetical protein [Chitinophagales bacterium]